ncbi:threonine/homoserine efflux transporter RhtA [Isoptericola jiangsuensis]|uniref:Threonine/homoserine efflux transporter RhtA n=1 Tax=Isoptericola jiangsuensis TaxID=548579 RepID=A0A2A9EXP8_9MICO|nr:EamA family transporter [Isoptericola jiangsuensis]PFG43824.1 threonine/homoserine efflux transporter RhtA [Isoptericola jiangsuensis]
MTTMAHDASSGAAAPAPTVQRSATSVGLALAVVSALSFSLSGPLAATLFATGWSPGAVVLVRVATGALLVAPFGIAALRGDWSPVRRSWRVMVAYGALGVAGAQFCYFAAIQHMQVGTALLIEYTAPAAVVGWFWARHGQRPGGLTLTGVGLAAAGLVLVLDLSGAAPSPVGVAWALAAMVGAATYFVINAHPDTGLPPLTLAAGGLTVGTVLLGTLGAVGLMPLTATSTPATLVGLTVPPVVVLALLGLVTAGLAYVTGIAAGRRLGARRASFVGLLEVVSAVALAWLLLGELPAPVQLLGGLLVLAGVVAVQQGEAATARRGEPAPPVAVVPTDAP